jgi:hypothetical protein
VLEFEKTIKDNGYVIWNFATNLAYKDIVLFQDEIHLNQVGAAKWSKEISALLMSTEQKT